ncbi:MAG: Hsp20/alpha crystallin family protein [Blastocatellia bacterium]|nr:Hsp20/alpha crystallin family protein [Blastocatellia bacterium]
MANTNPLQIPSNILVEQLRDQMRRMLVRLDEIRQQTSDVSGVWMPAVDVLEMDEAILVRIELPGVGQEHLRVTVIDNTLKIEGRKERDNPTGRLDLEERPIRFLCLERSYGSFSFTVTLHWQIDPVGVAARLTDGVLRIQLPKTSTSGREITIPITE